jgi:hypothetical protein
LQSRPLFVVHLLVLNVISLAMVVSEEGSLEEELDV